MKNFLFLSKADTIAQLVGVLKTASILPQICFTAKQWEENPSTILEMASVTALVNDGPVIVRSSAQAEDKKSSSFAGRFTSIADCVGKQELIDGINKVIESFSISPSPDNQVFLQPMLENISYSGVAFSREPNTGGHYYVINYDNDSHSSDSVTSGKTNSIRTFYCDKLSVDLTTPPILSILFLIRELENLFDTDSIDIEFAANDHDELFLLQVRPLRITVEDCFSQESQSKHLQAIYNKIDEHSAPHPYLFGEKSIFGVMPDWNPAEIIGIRPRQLALSLYKELVTDNVWAYQRNNYGYKNLRSFPLLVSLGGMPYIDVRVSFNSFIPKEIDADLAAQLVNYYIHRLETNPELHDKIEFTVIYSCYTFDIHKRLRQLLNYGFSKDDCNVLARHLKSLTKNIIKSDTGLWQQDINKIKELDKKCKIILNSRQSKISKIYWLLEDCKRYGTLPFAGLALPFTHKILLDD